MTELLATLDAVRHDLLTWLAAWVAVAVPLACWLGRRLRTIAAQHPPAEETPMPWSVYVTDEAGQVVARHHVTPDAEQAARARSGDAWPVVHAALPGGEAVEQWGVHWPAGYPFGTDAEKVEPVEEGEEPARGLARLYADEGVRAVRRTALVGPWQPVP